MWCDGACDVVWCDVRLARKGNYKIDANQELLPNGVANILGSFVNGYAVSGTFSRWGSWTNYVKG